MFVCLACFVSSLAARCPPATPPDIDAWCLVIFIDLTYFDFLVDHWGGVWGTSDSSTALRVMQLVAGVASRGTTVLCSLHQPRPAVAQLLDRVILLSRGAVAFSGAPDVAESYFTSIGRGRPFLPIALPRDIPGGSEGGNELGKNEAGLEVNPADAMLDAVGESEALADRQEGGESDHGGELGALVAMPREVLLEQARSCSRQPSHLEH